MEFFVHLGNSWRMLLKSPLFVLVGCLLVSVLVVISLGLLIGPLYGAFTEALIQLQRDGRQPRLKDLFSGFARFRQLFPMFFLALLVIVGFKLFVLPGLLILTMWIYTLPIVADSRLTLVPAMNESSAMIKDKGFLKHLGFLIVLLVLPSVLINMVAGEADFLKVLYLIIVPPLQFGFVASLYIGNFPHPPEPPAASTPAP
jgi:hypothetical protein